MLKSFITPALDRLFYPDEQIYDITFIGRTLGFPEREIYLQYLLQNDINVQIRGGYVQENVSWEEYARIVRQSKINLSFCHTPQGWPQAKGRVHEVIASQSLLLESYGPITSQYYQPDYDYVLFNTLKDLLNKVIYYLNNNNERCQIATNGYNTYKKKYHYTFMWDWINQQLW